MVTDMATNYVFQDFTGDTSEGHWAVIFCKVAVTLFKDRGDQGLSPIMWYLSWFNGLGENTGENGG